MRKLVRVLLLVLLGAAVTSCGGNLRALMGTPDNHLYVGGVAQPEGPVAIGRSSSFRFVEKWRISHVWVQGTGVRPCRYRTNLFRLVPGYPRLAAETETPMFERDGKVFFAEVLPKTPNDIFFWEFRYQIIGEMPNGFQRTGYTPFCSQAFPTSPNGMSLWIVKPDPEKGTDDWIAGAISTNVQGRVWLVKKVPPRDLGPASTLASTIEYWTLRIPDTPYWLHLRFSGSLRSVREFPAQHERLLQLFHQIIESVRLEPIAPIDPASMPPFVLHRSLNSTRENHP